MYHIEVPMDIDFSLLRKQKFVLLDSAADNDYLDGLINVIDRIEDCHPDPGEDSENIYGPDCLRGNCYGRYHPFTGRCLDCNKLMPKEEAALYLHHDLAFIRETARKALEG